MNTRQTLRIIGGQYRGKKLSFPDLPGLRPTPDRVRETVFNWLMHHIHGTRCLDAFAGSGALGFEAYSRGASRVVWVEQAPAACTQLKKNLALFPRASACSIINQNALHYLKTTQEQFDLVFLDPPFAQQLLPECLDILAQRALLAPAGIVYIESEAPVTMPPQQWQEMKLKKAGKVFYGLYRLFL